MDKFKCTIIFFRFVATSNDYSLMITGYRQRDRLLDTCHLRHLRLLRVLSLYSCFLKVEDSLLNHLRFLRIGTQVKSLPSSFSNLWNLETLLVENDKPPLVLLPGIWNLVKLRVLVMSCCSFFDLDTDEPVLIAEDTKLENLRFLGQLMLSYSINTEDIFKRFPNLQVLELHNKGSYDYSIEQYWFPKLDFLNELESLRVGVGFESSNTSVATKWSWDFHFPSNLKQLRLYDFPLTSDALSTIARLPNLKELTLVTQSSRGENGTWGRKTPLRISNILRLDEVTLTKWKVEDESFPVLEKLYLLECDRLEESPPRFGDICSLKVIKLVESPQLNDSAMKIKKYVEDMMGGDEFLVVGRNNIPLLK